MRMMRQYLRNIRLLVGNSSEMHDFSKLRITFEVKLVQMVVPDRCMISIYNVSEEMIAKALESFTNVQLEVGYDGYLSVLYSGEITYWRTYWEDNNVDRVLTLFSAQNQRAFQYGFMKQSFDAGATANDVAKSMEESWVKMGVSRDPAGMQILGGGTAYPRGHVMYGRTADYSKSLGRDYNIVMKPKNGKVSVESRTQPDTSNIQEVNYNTGLLKQPEIVELGIQCKCLLNTKISSGGMVHLETKDIIAPMPNKDTHIMTGLWGRIATSGLYYVLDVTHKGDTWGQTWETSFLAALYPNIGKTQELVQN